tara:strand:- start:211 stop:465 length:255 start_codon:yes stop_codon:yes gene_type:complete
MTIREQPSYFELAFGGGTPKKAFITCLIVGSILTLINHGDTILYQERNPNYFKVILTYIVPYCVTTWGAVIGKIDGLKINHKNE